MSGKKIEFSRIKELSMGALQGNHLRFVLCLMFSAFSLMVITPANYVLMFANVETALTVMDMFRVLLGTVISEFIMFTLVASMYKIIFLETEEKKGIRLLLKYANEIFPSCVIPVVLTKTVFSFLSFLTSSVVSGALYDYLLFNIMDYRIYLIIMAVLSMITSILSLVFSVMYIFAPCVIADGNLTGGIQILKTSRRLIKGRKINMILFIISFAPWIILGMMCFGIGLFWVQAYIYVAIYFYYKECLKIIRGD